MIRVLVAEDSATSRALVTAILASDPGITVVGEAADGGEAVAMARALRPDLVTMDVHMPGMSGYEATRRIMEEAPTRVVIVSGDALADVEAALRTLQVGALAAWPKPCGPGHPGFEREARELVDVVKTMSQVEVVRRFRARGTSPPRRRGRGRSTRVELVAVAASTGGPAALHRVLSGLPADFSAPIAVVQHMAPAFVQGLVEWLSTAGPLRVTIAEDGQRLEPGTVYVAPPNRHLSVAVGTATLVDDPPHEGFRPSGTVLFAGAARAYGAAALGLILSGMGQDGLEGLKLLARAGGSVIAQSEETSSVFGMPKAAIEAGIVHQILEPPAMSAYLRDVVGRRA